MFPVTGLLEVEMIRDGGSLTATFEIEGGRQFILMLPIEQFVRVWRGPVLIDPEKRATNALSGASVPVSWTDARQALAEMTSLSGQMEPLAIERLRLMTEIAEHEGYPPSRRGGT
jgi:hypothetical protein